MDSIADLLEKGRLAMLDNKRLLKENNHLKRVLQSMVTSDYRDNREEIIKGIQDAIAG